MGSAGSIYDPVGNSLDCGDRREIMGGNGTQRGVLTAPTRQENIRDKSMLVIFSSPQSPPPPASSRLLQVIYSFHHRDSNPRTANERSCSHTEKKARNAHLTTAKNALT